MEGDDDQELVTSVENMVAEVTLHNNTEMSKNCKKSSKIA